MPGEREGQQEEVRKRDCCIPVCLCIAEEGWVLVSCCLQFPDGPVGEVFKECTYCDFSVEKEVP